MDDGCPTRPTRAGARAGFPARRDGTSLGGLESPRAATTSRGLQTAYDLDLLDNWDTKTTDGVPEVRTHNEANEILANDTLPVAHDDNGNLSQDDRHAYAYDEENRLTAVTRIADARVVGQYAYDALGRRVQKVADPDVISAPVTTFYYHDDARIIEEQDSVGATLATYTYGNYVDEVLTMDRGGATLYYHPNTLWSVHALTDAAGLPVERYAYGHIQEPPEQHGGD
jgi:YD repeat-containing protein